MIILFTDMFQNEDGEKLFNALQHLKHNKHKVVLFHVIDKKTEINFNFDNTPRKFVDVESGEVINIFADNIKEEYEKKMEALEPQMEAYAEKMANVDEQMKPFEKEMELYEQKMQKFEKEMEIYVKKLEARVAEKRQKEKNKS